jgi:hypothetical protein
MKRLLGIAMLLTLILSVAPVLAGDAFHALSQLPATDQAALTPLDDAQLATIEGGDGHDGQGIDVCRVCSILATVTRGNVAPGDCNALLQAEPLKESQGDVRKMIDALEKRYGAASVHQGILGIFQGNWPTGAPGQQANVARITQRPQ